MKILNSRLILILFILMFIIQGYAFNRLDKNAFTLPAKTKQIGLFAPLYIASSDSVLWQTHPIWFVQMPNLQVKIAHLEYKEFAWASEHGFVWPTYLLRLVAREGTGGLISPEFDIPQMVAINNGVVVSKKFSESLTLSLKGSLSFALIGDKLDERTTIDLPFIYPRMAVFYNGIQVVTGIHFGGQLSEKWGYDYSTTMFVSNTFAFESSGSVKWKIFKRTQLELGYYYSFAEFPFGTQAHLLLPLIDIVWQFGGKEKY